MRSFCVIGLGCFGFSLAKSLISRKCQVMVISPNAEQVNLLADDAAYAVIGDPTNEATLRTAGVTDYDCAVVCIDDSMNDSILATMILKDLGVKEVVARAMNDRHRRVLDRLGADMVVFPEEDMGDRIAQILAKKDILDYFSFSEECSIAEINIPKDWVGKSIIENHIRNRYGVTVIALRHQGGQLDFAPDPSVPLLPDDTITIMGRDDSINKISSKLN